MRTASKVHALACLCLVPALLFNGCAESMGPPPEDPGDDDDDELPIPAGVLFSLNIWAAGSGFSPDGVEPEWGFPAEMWDHAIGASIFNSNPALGSTVPLPEDEITNLVRSTAVLTEPHLSQIVATMNSGMPNKAGDLALLPSLAMFHAPGEDYEFFQINLNSLVVPVPQGLRSDDPEYRTRVIGIAFGNGSGGYVAQAPFTGDTFAGALVWMKATRNPYHGFWSMDQRDWRTGAGNTYGTSLRMLIRGDAVVAVIRKSELAALGVTQFRWDTYSYTTDVSTAWSHDFTDWQSID